MKSHELGATTTFLTYHRGCLIRVVDGNPVPVWTCNHAHRSRDAAHRYAVAERARRERHGGQP